MAEPATAVTFDYGQTLAELDHDFLALRVSELGGVLDPGAARTAHIAAWDAYGAAKTLGHEKAWQLMMVTFLRAGGARPAVGDPEPHYAEALAKKLWDAQPTRNLWRKRIPGMFELVRELVGNGVPVGIISNSEGRLAELLAELGEEKPFRVIVDSGRVRVDKPNPRIFQLAADGLHVELSRIVHVGDAWEADVIGAVNAGARAVWFAPTDERALPNGVVACRDAAELRAALDQDFGLAR